MLKVKIQTVLEKPLLSCEMAVCAKLVARMRNKIEEMRFISQLVYFFPFHEGASKVKPILVHGLTRKGIGLCKYQIHR
jgi:hypothetical protein